MSKNLQPKQEFVVIKTTEPHDESGRNHIELLRTKNVFCAISFVKEETKNFKSDHEQTPTSYECTSPVYWVDRYTAYSILYSQHYDVGAFTVDWKNEF